MIFRLAIFAACFVSCFTLAEASDWYSAPGGTSDGQGTQDSPWDIESTLDGRQKIAPGDTLWLLGGTYKHPNRQRGNLDYLAEGNVCYDAGRFLIGGGRPSRGIRVFDNYLHNVDMQLGYSAPENEDCEVRGNVIVNGGLSINKFKQVVQKDNLILRKTDPRPADAPAKVVVRPNRYDAGRFHVIIFNWAKRPSVEVDPGEQLKLGESYRLSDPRDLFGQPTATGVYDGNSIHVPMSGEFAVLVLSSKSNRIGER